MDERLKNVMITASVEVEATVLNRQARLRRLSQPVTFPTVACASMHGPFELPNMRHALTNVLKQWGCFSAELWLSGSQKIALISPM